MDTTRSRSGSLEIKPIIKGVLTAGSHGETEQEANVARDWPPPERRGPHDGHLA